MSVTLDISAHVNGMAGLGRYAASLAAALAVGHPGDVGLFANYAGSRRDGLWAPLRELPFRQVRLGYKPWRMAVWLGQLAGIGFDGMLAQTRLFHATEHLLLPLRRTPTVLTVHDLIFKLYPEHHKRLNFWYLNAALPLYVRRADHIIAVSACTKRDLITHYGTPEGKITVVYEAAAPGFEPQSPARVAEVRARLGLPDRYLLAVGTIEPRKNLARLVEALAILRRDDPDLRLAVVGARGWLTESFFAAIEQHGQREAVILPGYVTDDDLPAVYSGAQIAVSASLYEGFGLPVLEAMACGTPTACSSTSSLGEIAGKAAATFDPHNVESLTDTLRKLLADRNLRDHLRKAGLARAAEFSWARAARETWAVYERVMAES